MKISILCPLLPRAPYGQRSGGFVFRPDNVRRTTWGRKLSNEKVSARGEGGLRGWMEVRKLGRVLGGGTALRKNHIKNALSFQRKNVLFLGDPFFNYQSFGLGFSLCLLFFSPRLKKGSFSNLSLSNNFFIKRLHIQRLTFFIKKVIEPEKTKILRKRKWEKFCSSSFDGK